ncbi:MAG: ribosome silencing factor [Syntrophorhabdaceae bacterium]|nr:ribosome silencing factor [Syntrophorhabdaceae bacterium]
MEKVNLCGIYAEEKKARHVVILDLKGLTDIADFFLIADGTSERHIKTICDNIEEKMEGHGLKPYSVEGYKEGRWVIMDYGDVVVHLFIESLRELYDLDSLWIEAKRYGVEKEHTRQAEVKNGKRKA